MRKLLSILFLFPLAAAAQYAPLSLTLTNPNSSITGAGNQTLYDFTTLTSAKTGALTFVNNYFATSDTGALLSGAYSRTVEFDMQIAGPLTGNRATALFFTNITATTGNVNQNGIPANYGTLNSQCVATVNDNGTGTTLTTSGSSCIPFNFITKLGPNATNWYSQGGEIDNEMDFGSSAALNWGLQVAKSSHTQAVAAQDDFAIGIGNQVTSSTYASVAVTGTAGQFSCTCANVVVGDSIRVTGTNSGSGTITGYANGNTYFVSATNGTSTMTLVDINSNPLTTTAGTLTGLTFLGSWAAWGWGHGFTLCGPPCNFPIAASGTIIDSQQPGVVKNIINFSLITCTSKAIWTTGYILDCAGNEFDNTINIANNGNLSAPAWLQQGLVLTSGSITMTDTTSTGTVASAAGAALGVYTLNSTNAVTYTNWTTLALPTPVCTGNATCSNLWSLTTTGGIRASGLVNAAGGFVTGGSGSTTNINTQSTDNGAIQIGNSSNTGNTKLLGLATGTNADFLCLSAGGVVLIQTSACTISSVRYKDILGDWSGSASSLIGRLQVVRFMLKPALWGRDENAKTIQAGLTAENVAATIPECAVYDQDMATPKSYRQECVLALLVRAQQEDGQRQFWTYIAIAGLFLLLLWSLNGRRTA